MRRRTWVGLTVGIALALLGWGLWPTAIPDPVVRGRPLSAWLDERGPKGLSDEAEAAVRSLGPEAVPTLMAWISLRDSAIVSASWWVQGMTRLPVGLPNRQAERNRAMFGLRALGPAGRSAWPALAALALHSPDVNQRGAAINSLTSADAEVARALAAGTVDPDPEVRLHAIFALQCLHLAAAEVTYPALERLQTDPDPVVRAEAAQAIRFMDSWIAKAVVSLKAPEPELRAWTARLIGEHAAHARALRPDLKALADDPDPAVRAAVAEAIRRVDGSGPGDPAPMPPAEPGSGRTEPADRAGRL